MHLLTLATLLSWLIALVWIFFTLSALRNLPGVPTLHPAQPEAASEPGPPQVTVIVPARNEAQSIEQTLRSLLAQTIPVDVIAVDDRSTDATGAIMDRVAAEARAAGKPLRVLHIDTLPDGWMGKTHAMARAARQAATPWLLFTDGDILYRADTLALALRFAAEQPADHLVLMPTMIVKTAGERMMIAVIQALSLLTWKPWRIADPKAKRDSIGVGAFNLVRAEVYRAVGGFEAQRMEVLEDLRFGFEIKRAGYRQRFVFGRGLIQVHWASSALGLVRNLTKNVFAVFHFSALRLLGACAALGLLCLAPLAELFGPVTMHAAGLISLFMLWLLYREAGRRMSGISSLYFFTLPVAAVLIVYSMIRSMVVTLAQGGVVWRGTFYPLRELKKHAGPLR
ncbi:glycosyltransferase [Paracidobacterium acidisoli]|uniref:Glycosyltransferase n=1 Tax=Paracidobacterium acidisoli TaxID=2303751 RepID=A0A372ITU8_9BACT|nr:glycosyltransferase family 2 protein [Paracidobacterium acidisoli]MBT9329777.1 glycosyltransferase family 2 protein [Paracidobacterium acidisoli]